MVDDTDATGQLNNPFSPNYDTDECGIVSQHRVIGDLAPEVVGLEDFCHVQIETLIGDLCLCLCMC